MKLSDYKYQVDYTWINSKTSNKQTYDLTDPAQRKLYFNDKAGSEITKLREYMSENSFIAYLMSPKQGGKGTLIDMLKEALGDDLFEVVSVGDLVRNADEEFQREGKKSEVYKYTAANYRGMMSMDEIFTDLVNRSTKDLRPTEFILTLIKREIDRIGRKTIILDGFSRNLDQLSYSLYFRDLINYRNDPDLFILLHIPINLIDARIKDRRVCPHCKASKNQVLNPTKRIEYDKEAEEFYFVCDDVKCNNARLVAKEGDELGIKNIEDRVAQDLGLIANAKKMYGIPKVELYNSIPVSKAKDYAEEYEITPSFSYSLDKNGKVQIKRGPFTLEEKGEKYISLLPAATTLQCLKQLVEVLGL